MPTTALNGTSLHYRDEGDPQGAPVLFLNALGTTLHLWDAVLPHLPERLRIIRYDMRGHGGSAVPPAPYGMGALVKEAEALLDHLKVTNALLVGVSLGGMVAQGLAVKRLDLVRALVLSNTAAKIGAPKMWDDRIATAQTKGLPALSDAIMARWFSRDFQATGDTDHWRAMLHATPPEGYAGCCAAIKGTDFYTPTSGLRLPTLGIAGSEDGATPPDLVRETIDLIPGSRFTLMRRVGHLPCVEKPAEFAALLSDFMKETGHV
ncbi:3-oxoadipate enol-lactonase [Shimia marina]|uniref:3-oxoadipate enol-lactonase 2 n=1 Tax=Shimia marina TaxID=321267 RepID=A0A0P1ETX1_9RHOB|nr:3-oxoadipate enol-lactonase [Shimia marina]CUH54085.1 3-oxoadipate enol-lactonase 2 [Shimia marina]SFE60055.1 3-oxoadipate enol-lactonase [Shimia marina]